jgi:hypothetical protein
MIVTSRYLLNHIKTAHFRQSAGRKPSPFTICPLQTPHDLGSNPGRQGEKPAITRLSYGTGLYHSLQIFKSGSTLK